MMRLRDEMPAASLPVFPKNIHFARVNSLALLLKLGYSRPQKHGGSNMSNVRTSLQVSFLVTEAQE